MKYSYAGGEEHLSMKLKPLKSILSTIKKFYTAPTSSNTIFHYGQHSTPYQTFPLVHKTKLNASFSKFL
jgi:hypothetical protein